MVVHPNQYECYSNPHSLNCLFLNYRLFVGLTCGQFLLPCLLGSIFRLLIVTDLLGRETFDLAFQV